MKKLIQGSNQLGLSLTPKQIDQFQLYYEELVSWNKRINLTRVTEYEEVQVKHFLDSLTLVLALEELGSDTNLRLLDVGTGAGLPGIPLKILFPAIGLVLVESIAKKVAFLRYLLECLGLSSVEVVTARAEDLGHQADYREKFDVVLSRAVGELASVAELTLPFCRIGGTFIAQKKGQIEGELHKASKAIATLGGKLKEVKRVELSMFEKERLLVIISKIYPTPQIYPRRAGVPARHPL